MVSALGSGSAGPGSSPGRGPCVVFLGKTLYSHSASLHPGVQMDGLSLHPCDGLACHPGESINTPSTGPMGHLGPYKGFTFY